MSRTRSVMFLIVLVLVMTVVPARAGGWWHYVDFPEAVASGETLEVSTRAMMFETIEQADRARAEQGFYAYLIEDLNEEMVDAAMSREFDPDWWRLSDATAYQAGTVTIEEGSSNLARGTVSLEIPDVDPGRYALMLCDLDCATPLANVIPIDVEVTADQEIATLTRKVEYLGDRLVMLRINLRRDVRRGAAQRGRDLNDLKIDLANVTERLNEKTGDLEESLTDLGERVEELEKSDGRQALGWLAFGGFLLIGVAYVRKKDRRSRRSFENLEGEAVIS